MAVVSDIELRIRADIARLQNDMTAARRTVDNGLSGITRAADLAKKALGAIGVGFAFKEFAGQVLNAQREFDKLNSSLVTATGSTANAAQAFAALQKFAASTPYSVVEATEAFIKLKNQGLDPSERALRSYGNTASSQSKSLDQFIEAVADASRSQFERLNEFSISAKQSGDKVALTFKGLTTVVGNNSKEIQQYLMKIGETDFAGAMERRANTLDGAISNLGDSYDGFLRKVAAGGAGSTAEGAITGLSAALGDLGDILDAVAGKADSESKKLAYADGIHKTLTITFQSVATAGVILVGTFKEVGNELAALASASTLLVKGDLAGVKAVLTARSLDFESLQRDMSNKIRSIWTIVDERKKAAAEEQKTGAASTKDQLAGFAQVLTAEQKQSQALTNSLEVRNRLNGVNAQTAGDLKKLKEAYDTGGITLAQYNKFVAQINKETTLGSTAYKDSVKAIDLSTAAVQRRAAAQAFANQQTLENLDFLKRTGQINEEDYIKKAADADVKALQDAKKALEATRDLEAKKVDSKVKVMDLNGQIDEQERKINARRTKEDNDLFELAQKYRLEGINNASDLIEAARTEQKVQKDRTRDMQDEIDMLGMTAQQIAEVTAARLREQAAALERRASIGIIEEENDALREQAAELRKQADLGLTKQRVQEQQKFWGDVEQTAHDTFVSIADGGKGAFQRLKDSAKNIFFEWLYQMTLKKWIINIGASADGVAATAGLASSGSSLLNAASNIGSLYKSITGLATGNLGTGFVGSLVGGLNGAGAGSGLASSLGLSIGNTIADTVGPQLAGALSTGISGLATALPWVGGAVAIYSLAKSAFGMGPKQYADNSTLSGTLGAGGFSGSVNTSWTQKGGWFRSNKSGIDRAAVDAVTSSGLSATYSAIKDATSAYAKVLGLNADAIAGRSQTLNIALGKDQAANQKAIADFFVGVGDAIATEILPSIGQFQAAGESASATLQRLAVDFQAVDTIMATVGVDSSKAFNLTGAAAIEARERLISLAGGLDNLATQTKYFYDNFETAAEKIGPIQKQVADQLAAIGLPGVRTIDEFRGVVQRLVASGEIASEGGSKTYAALLALAPQFKEMVDTLKEINQGAVDKAMAALGRAVDAQKDLVTEAYNAAMTTLDARIDDVNGTIERTTQISQALKQALVGVDTPQAGEIARQAAQAQVTAFLAIAKAGGALPDYDQLQNVLSALQSDSTGSFSNLADYQRSVARTNAELEQLGGITDGQLSTAQKQLALLQDQKTIAQTAYEAQIARLDAVVTAAQAQLDAINGVDNSILSVEAAVASVQATLLTLAAGNTSGSSLGASVLSTPLSVLSFGIGALREMITGTVPTDNSFVPSGTMTSNSSTDMNAVMARLASMEASAAATADATAKLADQFNQVSAGGNYLLVGTN